MAARTLTYTNNMAVSAKALHAGPNILTFDFNSGATKFGTLSDMLLIGKVPNGALVTQSLIRMGLSTAAAAHYTLVALVTEAGGTYSQLSIVAGSMTASTAAVTYTNAIPAKVSFSDDRAVQFAVLALNCTTGASETVSVSIQGSITFLTDGSVP